MYTTNSLNLQVPVNCSASKAVKQLVSKIIVPADRSCRGVRAPETASVSPSLASEHCRSSVPSKNNTRAELFQATAPAVLWPVLGRKDASVLSLTWPLAGHFSLQSTILVPDRVQDWHLAHLLLFFVISGKWQHTLYLSRTIALNKNNRCTDHFLQEF